MGEPFTHRLRVRYAECDRQDVVFNSHYLAYFDVSMTELWRAAFGGYRVMMEKGYDLVVAEARLRFANAARFDDELMLEVAVTKLGNSSILTQHRIVRGDELLVEGDMCHVLVDLETLRKAPIPDWASALILSSAGAYRETGACDRWSCWDLSEDERLCRTLDLDPLTLLSGQLDQRSELPILLTMLDEAAERAGPAVMRRWVRASGPSGSPIGALERRDFATREDRRPQLHTANEDD